MNTKSRTEHEPIEVLYTGNLPVFRYVGSHPQFHHLKTPPIGYEFIQTGSFSMRRLGHLSTAIKKLFLSAVEDGIKPDNLFRFLQFIKTRGIRSQLKIPTDVRLAFVPSFPFTLGQVPWVIEIEDTTTLFDPFIFNGQTASIEIADTLYFPFVKALIESDNCRGIICHVKSTAESIPVLFNNLALREKTTYIPMGVQLPARPLRQKTSEDSIIRILFTNSWHQDPNSFYCRGGIDLLEAFSILASKYPNIRLTLRTRLPLDLNPRYLEIIERLGIKVLDQFLSMDEMESLISNADIYALPSARVHVVSILQAMGYGKAVVVSDGWGIQEYVEDKWSGLVVAGRYGKCAWMDTNGVLREDYRHLRKTDPVVVSGLVEALSALIEDKVLREKISQNARREVETRFSIENWNQGLKKVFDQAIFGRPSV